MANVGQTDGVTVNYSIYDSFIVIVSNVVFKCCKERRFNLKGTTENTGLQKRL